MEGELCSNRLPGRTYGKGVRVTEGRTRHDRYTPRLLYNEGLDKGMDHI